MYISPHKLFQFVPWMDRIKPQLRRNMKK